MFLRELHFFLTHIGVLVGSIALVAMWLLLAQLSQRGRTVGAVIARSLRRPLILGFGSALYLGWLGRLIARYVEGLDGAIVFKISLSLFIASVGWGVGQLGNAVMDTWFEDWLQIEDQADEQMLINLIQRVFTILVAIGTTAALMVNFGVSTQAVATVLGGEASDSASAPSRSLRISSRASCCFSTNPSNKGTGSMHPGWKEP